MTDMEQFQTKNLFLLIGTNPLPNYVAAKLLLAQGGTIYLIHSRDTATVAERLERYLRDKKYRVKMPQTVVEADAQDIENRIRTLVGELDGSVGLNYTGGTKAMAVHAYRAVEQIRSDAVFSYLDAKTFEMRIDRPQWREQVLLRVTPSLEDLLNLHGAFFQKGSPKSYENIVMLPVAQALAQAASRDGLRDWRQWCDQELRQKAHSGSGWKAKRELRTLELRWPTDESLAEVVQSLREALGLEDSETLPLDPAKIPGWPFRKRDPERLCRWLDGEWLEHYVLHSVVSVAGPLKLHDCVMNLKTDRDRSDVDLELDVAAMRGYQLFGISCTTSVEKHLVKSKLFEAYVRVRQLGGDEARVGLISGWSKPEKFEREVARAWDAKGKIKVFGPQHLADLGQELDRWFKTAA